MTARSFVACLLVLLGTIGTPDLALADTVVISRPGAHPSYSFEAEPHLLIGALPAPKPARGTGFGFGFRGTVELVDNGFISSINNSVGFGFGADWVHYGDSNVPCPKTDSGQCRDSDPDFSLYTFSVPVTMQWNFWLSRSWSVFGEPGVSLRYVSKGNDSFKLDPFVLWLGGRYHFEERITLTLRVGYPVFSVGVSFLF
jgi:hypothetical protein